MADQDIVEYLRRNAAFNYKNTYIAAADEIERLRGMLEVQDEMVKHYVAERDEARREVCESDTETHGGALLEAERRGWDCFKEKP